MFSLKTMKGCACASKSINGKSTVYVKKKLPFYLSKASEKKKSSKSANIANCRIELQGYSQHNQLCPLKENSALLCVAAFIYSQA
jgi:hypothetical protein